MALRANVFLLAFHSILPGFGTPETQGVPPAASVKSSGRMKQANP